MSAKELFPIALATSIWDKDWSLNKKGHRKPSDKFTKYDDISHIFKNSFLVRRDGCTQERSRLGPV